MTSNTAAADGNADLCSHRIVTPPPGTDRDTSAQLTPSTGCGASSTSALWPYPFPFRRAVDFSPPTCSKNQASMWPSIA
jgi:hypothetical protein